MKITNTDIIRNLSENGDDMNYKLMQNKKRYCSNCGTQLKYLSLGDYICPECGHKEKDDYGIVREYIEKNGPSPSYVIHMATGVPEDVINTFVKKGKLEVSDTSPVFFKCEQCGTDIKYGRLCPMCAKSKVAKVKGYFIEEVGETPKVKERMRFLGKRKLDKDNK